LISPDANLPAPTLPAQPEKPAGLALWVQRVKLGVRVIFFVGLGMLLVILPWTSAWTHNSLLSAHLLLREWLNLGFVRGCLSGLGLVNVWIGIQEAVHYRES
jgi:hypothetical protein